MNQFLTCNDCESDFSLGPITADQDCTLYSQKHSQVSALIILPNETPLPSDWTDAQSWRFVLDNLEQGNEKGRYLSGEGEIQAPDGNLTEYPKRQLRFTSRLYEVELNIKRLTDDQYLVLKSLQCGWKDFRFWIETVGGRLLGGPNGISPSIIDVAFLYRGGRKDKEESVLIITYESDGDPPRADVEGLSDIVKDIISDGIGGMIIETDFEIA